MVIDINWLGHITHIVTPGITLVGHNSGNIHLAQLSTKGLHSGTRYTVYYNVNVCSNWTHGNPHTLQCGEYTWEALTVCLMASSTGTGINRFTAGVEFVKSKGLRG